MDPQTVNDDLHNEAAPAVSDIMPNPDLLPNLDFLRSVAVTLVVLRHLLPHVGVHAFKLLQPMGIAGVLIFFVHTCTVLMKSMERQLSRSHKALDNAGHETWQFKAAFYSDFILRRIFRIYPLSIVIVTVVYFAIPAMPKSFDLGFSPGHSGIAAYVSNLLLIQNLTHKQDIIGPLWSLPLECEMYVLLPLLFFFARRRSIGPLIGLWLLSMVLSYIQKKHPFFTDLILYLPAFIPGVICWKLLGKNRTLPFWSMPVLVFGGLLVYIELYAKIKAQSFVGAPFCLALGFLIPSVENMASTAGKVISEIIARYSYGVYLTHGIAIWIGFSVLSNAHLWMQFGAFIVALLVMPVILYHLVEARFIKIGSGLARQWFEIAGPARRTA